VSRYSAPGHGSLVDVSTGAIHQVSVVERTHWNDVSAALAAAFHDDPVFGWLLPDGAKRARSLRRFFTIETRRIVLRHGRSMATRAAGTSGAALVLPPGSWRTPLHVQALFAPRYAQIFRARLPRALGLLTHLERKHPRYPHVYFPYIGVSPEAQGNGLGTALLQPVLERCDREGVPAYLEASNPRCAVLYERLGFVGIEDVAAFGSPPIRLMVRR